MTRENPVTAIEVPYVDRSSAPSDVVSQADFLLTMLLRHDAGLLRAEFASDGGQWHVRGWTSDTSGPDELVAVTEKLDAFRRILARFGHHYMENQLYGGFAEGRFTQCGKPFAYAMYMANDAWRGYWLRVYSRKL